MNLKFMQHIGEWERAIRQFIVKNKLMTVCNVSVLLLTVSSLHIAQGVGRGKMCIE